MELEKTGNLPIDAEKLARAFPSLRPGVWAAINDISIANSLRLMREAPAISAAPDVPSRTKFGGKAFVVAELDQILRAYS